MDVTVTIDSVLNSSKPKDDVWAITKRLTKQSGTIEDLAQELVLPNGRTWTPGVYSEDGVRRNELWTEQQVFALDADSKGAVLSSGDIVDRCRRFGILPAFIHTSFSHTPELPKYRVVFVSPVVITSARVRDVIQLALMRIFPEFDQSTKDAARMFFGGKEIVYSDYGATLDIVQLFSAVDQKMREEDKGHAARNVKNWCQDVGLNTVNGLPGVYYRDTANIGEMTASSIEYSIELAPDSPKIVFSLPPELPTKPGKNQKYGKIKDTKIPYELIRGADFDALYNRCDVYRDMLDGVHLHHDVSFAIATNLAWLDGGETRFFEGLRKRDDFDENKWRYTFAYIRKVNYQPTSYEHQKIKDYYPNAAETAQATNIVNAAKVPRGEIKAMGNTRTIEREEAYKMLCDAANEAIAADDTKIYVFRFDTGVGKSTFIQTIEKPFLLAVPTHALKDQMVQDFASVGKNVAHTPALPDDLPDPVQEAIDRLYTLGATGKAAAAVRNFARVIPSAETYVKALDTALQTQETVVTTHARVCYAKTDHDLVVVDEDILPTIFQQSNVRIGDLIKLRDVLMNTPRSLGKNTPNKDVQILSDFITTIVGSAEHIPHARMALPFTNYAHIEKLILDSANGLSGNVLGVLGCSHYIRHNEHIFFIARRELPKNKKILVFSATANETLYRRAFGDRVVFIDSPSVRHKGKILQYAVNSSRNALKTKGVIEFAKTVIGDAGVITFKANRNDFEDSVVAHIGAVAGLNTFSGKPLAIIATPHMDDKVYALLASALGHTINPSDLSFKRHTLLKRNGFEFYFYTFDHELMREIQLHMVEAELFQAVGRARPIDNGVTVIVISDMPVNQAMIIELTPEQKAIVSKKIFEDELAA